MTTDDLTGALHACAAGLLPLEAGVALLAGNGAFLHRGDFTSRFIDTGASITDSTTPMAAVDWDAAITALTSAASPAPEANDASSCCPPASPEAPTSASATTLPA